MAKNPFSEKQALFSVITPVYQDAYKTLPKYFGALNEQAYKHFEIIISFDGKNPAGERELKKLQKQYPHLTVSSVTIEHAGAPAARNAGAKLAKGDIFTFLDPDMYAYPETFQFWAGAFEQNPDKDVVWGYYKIIGHPHPLGAIPLMPSGQPDYWAFRSTNYCNGAFPVRREAFVGWDETVKSLQDWDMWVRMLKKDNFEGKRFLHFAKDFFIAEPPYPGGLSDDSHQHWLERLEYVKTKNDIPLSPIVVTSLGAPFHALQAARKLGADFLMMPSFKPHKYKMVYLLGYYPATHEQRLAHLQVFEGDGMKAKKLIHWIGTDIMQLDRSVSSFTLRELKKIWKAGKFTMLSEVDYAQEEMQRIGVKTEVIPIPPQQLYAILPLPKKFTVGIYESAAQQMYEERLMQEVARSLPDIDFKFFGDESKKGIAFNNVEHLGWVDLDTWMPKLSCNVRITVHDGLPLTPLQFMTAGRNVVCNLPLKGTIRVVAKRKEIIEGIRKAQQEPLDPEISRYWWKELDPQKYASAIKKYL